MPNIPYCCLPQESGPCLSTSVGDRPLRSPSHRRLGGPSPRQPANGTHARPPPRLRFARWGMPPNGRMAYYPAFPPAIRLTGAGCIRVTHPCATLTPPKGRLPSDLHVLGLPLAFILSQDQTLRCTIVLLFVFSESRVPPRCSLWCSFYRFLASRGTRRAGLVLASDFQSSLRFRPSSSLLVPSESGCKSTAFYNTCNIFFIFFETFLYNNDYQKLKKCHFFRKTNNTEHKAIYFIPKRHILTKNF